MKKKYLYKGSPYYMAAFVVYRKPRVRRVVQFSLSDEEGKKTPFAI